MLLTALSSGLHVARIWQRSQHYWTAAVSGTAHCITAHYSSVGSVAVVVGLVGTVDRDADILRLLFGQGRELGADFRQVKSCDLLVQVLGQGVDVEV